MPARDNLCLSKQKSTRERETPKERQRMSTNHTEERELRLECYSTRYIEHQSVQLQLPLFNSIISIQAKMQKFMATLDAPTCSTCSENFPGLHFLSKSNECLHCSRDLHILKLYSFANNVNPGPIVM